MNSEDLGGSGCRYPLPLAGVRGRPCPRHGL